MANKPGVVESIDPSTVPSQVIAERSLEKLTPHGSRPGKVTIYQPVQTGPQEWRCRYVIAGVKDDRTIDDAGIGIDSVQALSSALFLVGVAFIREPAISEYGYIAWEAPPRSHVDDLVPLPLSQRKLGGADPPPHWLMELHDGVSALRALRDWLEAGNDTEGARDKIEGLQRGMSHLQILGTLPVQDLDIKRVAELRAALDDPSADLLPLVEACLLWWTRAGQSG